MNYFTRIHVEGFRRLHNVNLPLKPLNVMIGANGAGKTSLLDVFSIMSASAEGNLAAAMSEQGGIAANLTGGDARWISCLLATAPPERPELRYRIAIKPRGAGYEIVDEMLCDVLEDEHRFHEYIKSQHGKVQYRFPGESLQAPSWEFDAHETAISQTSREFRVAEEFRKQLASSTHYHVLSVEPRSPVRMPQPLRPAMLPGVDGEDLVSCLFYLQQTDRDRFEMIEDTLRAGFHDFERLDFPPVAAGTLAMTWRDRNFTQPLFMHQLSEGTLRFLWLVTLLYSPGLTALTLIDEPEVSLHPELLSLLADVMREASSRTQLIVATHADRLVRFLQVDEVVALDVGEDGLATATRASDLDLERWLDEYTLDEVWRMGRMGARP
jgi:predicted ATPase